jgi:dihydrofolate reductase
MITQIWAEDNQHGIGKDGQIPWHLKADVQFFRDTTKNHAVVMGRATYDSLQKKPLPSRLNIILTTDESFVPVDDSVKVAHDVAQAIKIAESAGQDLFGIGGGMVYESFMPFSDVLLVTKINHDFDADVFAAPIPEGQFYLDNSLSHQIDDDNPYEFTFNTYRRKRLN